jgi:hypothetical protein
MARIRQAGWTDVAYRDLTFGIVALHRAVKSATRLAASAAKPSAAEAIAQEHDR